MSKELPYNLAIKRDFSIDGTGKVRFSANIAVQRKVGFEKYESIYSTYIYTDTPEELENKIKELKQTLKKLITDEKGFLDKVGIALTESLE